MKLSLRSKFYILVVPVIIVLIAGMAFLILPQRQVQNDVQQINQGLAEVLPAEGFARHYERQLRECADMIATSSTEHFKVYQEARLEASTDIDGWIKAEAYHTGDTPIEHAAEIKEHSELRHVYREVSKQFDSAIALALSGHRPEAITLLLDAANGSGGTTVATGTDAQLADEEAQLNRYLDNLAGAIKSQPVLRLLGGESRVQNMTARVANAILAERFVRFYNAQAGDALTYSITGSAQEREMEITARNKASGALQEWGQQVELIDDSADRATSVQTVSMMKDRYARFNKAADDAWTRINAADSAGALGSVESVTSPNVQSSLTAAIDKEVENQKTALQEVAGSISSSSNSASWGISLVALLLMVVAVGGTFMVSRMVVGPVVKLRDAARRFGEGGSGVVVKVRSHDELGELASSFNEMAAARASAEAELVKSRDELEDRVERRTHELADMNEELRAQIEERERAEVYLRASERKYRELADTLPQAVFELNSRGLVTYVNDGGFEMFGYSPVDLKAGVSALQIIEEVDRDKASGAIRKMMDGTSTGAVREYLAKRGDGSTFPCVVYSSLITDGDGNPAGIRGILTDISERKRTEQDLMRINEELEGYAHTVSHDLKGPLTSTVLATSTLQRMVGLGANTSDPDFRQLLRVIENNVWKSAALIDDLLALAEAGQTPEKLENVDIGEVVDLVLEENAGALEKRKMRVEIEGPLGRVRGSSTHFYQLFANLIGNCIKHCDSEQPLVRVLRLDDGADGIRHYRIRDNGSGIPPEDLERIFAPFYKGGKQNGTGIGLATVAKIVRLYGGRITAHNDNGACFDFTLRDYPLERDPS